MPVRLGSPLPNFLWPNCRAPGGVCKWLKRAVLQTVARVALRVRAPPPLFRPFHVGRSSTAERCTVNAEIAGSNPVGRPFIQHGALAKRVKARDSLSRQRGFESRTPCQTFKSTSGGIHMTAACPRAHENDSSVSTDTAAGSLERFVHVPEKAYEILRPAPPVSQP